MKQYTTPSFLVAGYNAIIGLSFTKWAWFDIPKRNPGKKYHVIDLAYCRHNSGERIITFNLLPLSIIIAWVKT